MLCKTNGKQIDSSNISMLLVQGEHRSQVIDFEVPRIYDSIDLSDCTFILRGVSGEAQTEQPLTKTLSGEAITLTWIPDRIFTANAGPLRLELRAVTPAETEEEAPELVVKFSMAPILIRETAEAGEQLTADEADQAITRLSIALNDAIAAMEAQSRILLANSVYIEVLTESDYDALETKDESTLYAVLPD